MSIDAGTKSIGSEFSSEIPPELRGGAGDIPPGIGPYQLAWRRLRRNHVALAFGGLFLLMLVLCLLAPVYAHDIAHTTPAAENITGTVKVGGKSEYIVSLIGIPIGPTWHSHYFLGADSNGRDVAVRLLYGGRNSLQIGFVAGYFRGLTDGVISRGLDVIWAYPAVLLGVALGVTLAVSGISIGPLKVSGNSLFVPAIIVGVVYIPYVAKPIRAQVLQMRDREFVEVARQQGLSHARIMFGEILPNVASTIIVFIPLILANAILLEAALSFLGAGVQPPNPSWGTMISDGVAEIPAAIHLTLVPGIMLVLTVLGINVFGDGVRDALDPKAKVRI
jgi:peptide/nickel transport system permease protein